MSYTVTRALLLLCSVGSTALAQSHSASTSYRLHHAAHGVSGGQASNGSTITAETSLGDEITGQVSNVTVGGVQDKPNYIGQLYDVTSLTLEATPATVDEGGTRQLAVTATLDDSTLLSPTITDVQWSVALGPLTGIDSAGLTSADLVYENSPATAQGIYQDVIGQIMLTVLNIAPDNFGDYAGDGIDDDWQVTYYGEPPNTDAAPGFDKDGDGYDNTGEWLTGFDPLDSNSFFKLSFDGLSGTTADLSLNKVITDRTYTVKASTDLQSFNETVTTLNPVVEETEKTVQDLSATSDQKFYRVDVTKP
ncbi:MAG: hypothetical protein ACSHX8_01300 [Opitutaceae bacterium]